MLKYPEEQRNVGVPPPGRWVWSDDTQTVEFVSSGPTEEGVLRKRRQSNVNFNDLQQRSEWLAEVCTLNGRGRQSIRKSLSPAHLNAYRASVMKSQGDRITTDDVKRVAVSLLQENYSLPIPFCFLAILKSKELDEVLAALLLYLSYFFELKSLENTSKSLMAHHLRAQDDDGGFGQKGDCSKEAGCLLLQLHHGPGVGTTCVKSQCLYSFFCCAAWVTFGRKDLRDIQEEVGRLLYSDTFNTAVRKRSDGASGMTFADVNGSMKTGEADPKETGSNSTFKHRTSQRCPALSSIVNQRSPLMVSLLPSPKERSPHLFPSSRARRQSLPQAEHCDTKALTEQLNEQLASVSFGILGKPLKHFNRSTLIPNGGQKNNRGEGDSHDPESDVNNNSEDHPAIHAGGSRSSLMGPKMTGLARYSSTTHINTRNSAATVPCHTDCPLSVTRM
ncbi:protein phosphatase 1 regulatory subunit 36 isoform X2 [Epinephelus moara]|uniref:protein phosphatase 1 regulatory subunit 36 isoform X2 n=1 Tax=Epinephelus moara TaxID=300413 RepID=UPI00214E9400|nr:protein phosphatase 1 regulatory subunit 36 isoform X2 [Epinephelus moara]